MYEEVSKNKFPKNVFVVPYIDNMTRIMKKTDVMVSRAGASTLSEIIALKVPSILIPSPYVPDNHQYKNAIDLVEKDAAILIEEKDLTGELLIEKIDYILNNPSKAFEMKQNLEQFNVKSSATVIYETIKALVDRK